MPMLKVLGLCIFSISLLGSIHIDIVRDESAGVCPAPLCAVQNVCLPMTFNPIMSDSLFCYDLVAEQASLEDQAGQARYGAQLIMASTTNIIRNTFAPTVRNVWLEAMSALPIHTRIHLVYNIFKFVDTIEVTLQTVLPLTIYIDIFLAVQYVIMQCVVIFVLHISIWAVRIIAKVFGIPMYLVYGYLAAIFCLVQSKAHESSWY